MREPIRSSRVIRFGLFVAELGSGELRKSGLKVKLQERPFEILAILLERPGEVVTREEFRQRLWSADTFVDFDHSMNASISKLRAALDEDGGNPRFVGTVGRRGYRFMAPVDGLGTASSPTATIAEPGEAIGAAGSVSRSRRFVLTAGILAFIVLASFIAWQQFRSRAARLPAGRVMLAVLPFENLTGDAGQDYFSDGLTEEMIAQLGRLDPQRLGVIARTSVMHYKHSQEQMGQIGRELGVQYVLEGSVRRDSNKVRISAQLIQMRDQSHLWARQYDRELINLLALQGEIAQEIANGIQLTIDDPKRIESAHQASLSREAYEAYDLYLKGRYFWNKRTTQGFQHAIEYFEQAIAKDPSYARAHAGLADSYALMSGYSLAPQNEFMPKARAAAQRAVELDGRLAEAHTSLALITENYDWDWQNAEKEYRRAIQLDPNYATAHHWYAEYLAYQGRFDEAFAEIERARQLDPLSLIIATDNGAILYFSRQYDRAIKQFRSVLDMEPNFPRAHLLVFAYVQKGLFADALADIEKWRRSDDAPGIWSIQAYVYGRSGEQAEARRALEKLQQLNRRQQMDPAAIALAYVGMDNKDDAFAWLQKAYSEHSNALTALKVDPIYDPLRSDPRFQELLRRVGLAN
jgi:TolB-like protein/DNA-binding winged helix-turn-helix (wHTH) protein/Tfp pilus assembly protein PilF